MQKEWTYSNAGVNIQQADEAKLTMSKMLESEDPRVLNKPGAFASLLVADFPGIKQPVLVLKAEEPGSKQHLAFQHGRVAGICQDLIHHLINDIVVMGARPEVVLDVILCGTMEQETVVTIVQELAKACRQQSCLLLGGETSVQPKVIPDRSYWLNASIVGVVERSLIIDGTAIRPGDTILAVTSNGLHTNGYSLVRQLMEQHPGLMEEIVDGEPFLDVVLRPHLCYYHPLKGLLDGVHGVHGLAHITGGGIEGNLKRILPEGVDARIQRDTILVPDIFGLIQKYGNVPEADMWQTFNMGVGLIMVVDAASADSVVEHMRGFGCETYPVGVIEEGAQQVVFQ